MKRFNKYLVIRMPYLRKIFFFFLYYVRANSKISRVKYCENGRLLIKTTQKYNWKMYFIQFSLSYVEEVWKVLALQIKLMLATFRWSGKSNLKKQEKHYFAMIFFFLLWREDESLFSCYLVRCSCFILWLDQRYYC